MSPKWCVDREVIVSGRVKSMNESVLYTIDDGDREEDAEEVQMMDMNYPEQCDTFVTIRVL